jgi:hypothetical protein
MSVRRLGRVVVLLVALTACRSSGPSPAAPSPVQPTFTLSGRVTDAFIGPRVGLSGVSVAASRGAVRRLASTDPDGRYTIGELEGGTYEVAFAKPFYAAGATTVAVTGPTSLETTLLLDVPGTVSASDLTGYWSGTGTYPNAPFKLALVQEGATLRGVYVDELDASSWLSGSFSMPDVTVRVDFGDAVVFLEGRVEGARQISGVHRTSALGNRPYPFTMTR